MSLALREWKGAVQPASSGSPSGNVIYLNKGAGQPLTISVSIVEGAVDPRDAMPTAEQRFKDFITNSGITPVGSLQGDYRRAMIAALGLNDNDQRSIDSLFKELYDRENP